MPTATQMTPLWGHAAQSPHRSLELITAPLSEISRRSNNLTVCEPGRFELAGRKHDLPRYMFLGPTGGAEPLRIGIFAGLHGDKPAASFALLRFVRLLENNPEIARSYCLFLYPVSNPTGFVDGTRYNRNGKDLNREFWRNSRQPEIRLLQSELQSHALHGLI